jgi:hypothetical protein
MVAGQDLMHDRRGARLRVYLVDSGCYSFAKMYTLPHICPTPQIDPRTRGANMQPFVQRGAPQENDRLAENPTLTGRGRGAALLLAFDHACQNDDLEVAAQLLIEYEGFVTRMPLNLNGNRRGEFDSLIAAHSRLWTLLDQSDHGDMTEEQK